MDSKIRFAFPKGSLQEATVQKLKKAGVEVSIGDRNYSPEISDSSFAGALLRPQKFPYYIDQGLFDVAITGMDCVENYLALENKTLADSNIWIVAELIFSKRTSKKSCWRIITRQDSPVKTLVDLEGRTITTEMAPLVQKFFKEKGIAVNVEFSWGAAEAEVLHGLVDAAVDLSETNETLKSNPSLRVLDEAVFETNTVLIANKRSLFYNEIFQKVKQLAIDLISVLNAEKKVWLEMNVPIKHRETIKKILPGMKGPDELILQGNEYVKLRSLVDKAVVRELLPRLIAAGADDIAVGDSPNQVFSQEDLARINLPDLGHEKYL